MLIGNNLRKGDTFVKQIPFFPLPLAASYIHVGVPSGAGSIRDKASTGALNWQQHGEQPCKYVIEWAAPTLKGLRPY